MPTKAPTPPLLAVDGLSENPTFSAKKEIRRGEIKNRQRVFLVGRAGVTRPQASGLSFRDFFGNRFGFRRKIAPNQHNFGNCRPFGRLFRLRRAAPASGFSGGRLEIAMPAAWFFCYCRQLPTRSASSTWWYNGKCNTKSSRRLFLFDHSDSRFAQF